MWEKHLKAKVEEPPAARFRGPEPYGGASSRPETPATRAEDVKEAHDLPIPYDRFAEVVRAQVSKFGGGAADVKFRVVTKEGKVTMKVETDAGEKGGE